MKLKFTIFLLITALSACKLEDKAKNDGVFKVVCTTSMIGDCFKNVLGDFAEVKVLMGAGVDPHLYDPRPSDLKALNDADLIIYNGFHLEGKFIDKFDKLSKTKEVISLGDYVEAKAYNASQFENAKDPHFWFDPEMWTEALEKAVNRIAELYPNHRAEIEAKFKIYNASVKKVQEKVKLELAKIPDDKRILITSHDAFNYFGRSFNIKVEALQGISTLSEAGIKEISNLVDFIIEQEVRCVFIETSVSQKALKSVKENCTARSYEIFFGEELFSDAMGEVGTPEGTYTGMLMANAHRITNGILSHD